MAEHVEKATACLCDLCMGMNGGVNQANNDYYVLMIKCSDKNLNGNNQLRPKWS